MVDQIEKQILRFAERGQDVEIPTQIGVGGGNISTIALNHG